MDGCTLPNQPGSERLFLDDSIQTDEFGLS